MDPGVSMSVANPVAAAARGDGMATADGNGLSVEEYQQMEKELRLGHWIIEAAIKSEEGEQHVASRMKDLRQIIAQLIAAGLQVRWWWGSRKKRVFMQVWSAEERLLREADRLNIPVLLNPGALREADVRMNEQLQTDGLVFNPAALEPGTAATATPLQGEDLAIPEHGTWYSCWYPPMDPYAHIHAPFNRPSPDVPHSEAAFKLYHTHEETGSILSSINALKMLKVIIEAPLRDGGANIDLDRLAYSSTITKHWPAANAEEKERVKEEWITWFSLPWRQPLDLIRSYYGERIALYYAFLGYFSGSLAIPALLGVVLFFWQISLDNAFTIFTPVYGIIVALWAGLFVETWKRSQNQTAMEWGMTDFKKLESYRPEFLASEEVKHRRSFVHGKPVYYRSSMRSNAKMSLSSFVISFMIGIVIVLVMTIFFFNAYLLNSDLNENLSTVLSSSLTAVQIQIMTYVYTKVSILLTDYENQPTDTAYENSLVMKTFVFQFINNFSSLIYVAFIKGNIGKFWGEEQDCALGSDGLPNCLEELRFSLLTIFLVSLFVGNSVELGVPYLMGVINACTYKADDDEGEKQGPVSEAEAQSPKNTYVLLDDYLEQALLFGFTSLFVVAFPLVPLIAMFVNYLEIRVDAVKLSASCLRPVPRGAADMGAWQFAFEFISYASVISNAAVVLFTDQQSFTDPDGVIQLSGVLLRLQIFIIFEHLLLLVKFVINWTVPSKAGDTKLQLERQEYLVAKHMLGVVDEIIDTSQTLYDDNSKDGEGDGGYGTMAAAMGQARAQRDLRKPPVQVRSEAISKHVTLVNAEDAAPVISLAGVNGHLPGGDEEEGETGPAAATGALSAALGAPVLGGQAVPDTLTAGAAVAPPPAAA